MRVPRTVVSPRHPDRGTQALDAQHTITRKAVKGTQTAVKTLQAHPTLNDAKLSAALEAAVALKVRHPLKRQPEGWTIIDKDADANPFRVSWDANSITIQSAVAVNITFRIY